MSQAYGRGAALHVQGSGLKSAAIDLCGFETPGHQPERGGNPNNKNEQPALPDAGVHGTSDEEQDQSAVGSKEMPIISAIAHSALASQSILPFFCLCIATITSHSASSCIQQT
jgi:hypothetical protein